MKKNVLAVSLLILSAVLFASCSPAANVKATQATATATLETTPPTSTPQPSPTPQPGKVLLVAPAGADAQSFQAVLAELGGPAGLSVQTRTDLQKGDLTPEFKIVVMAAPAQNLAELVAAALQTQFVVVSSADLPASANLTVLRQRPEVQAFVAGYITVLLSTDYRGAGLLPADGPLGDGLKDAFANGAHYWCGVCAPGWPLNVYYPHVASLPSASDGPTWQSEAAGAFDNQKADVFYLSAEAARQEVFDYLQGKVQADKTVLVIGTNAPPEALKPQWAASIHADLLTALRQVWPDVASGKGGAVVNVPVVVDNVNPGLLGPGRMRLVKDLMDKIQAGKLNLFSVPAQ